MNETHPETQQAVLDEQHRPREVERAMHAEHARSKPRAPGRHQRQAMLRKSFHVTGRNRDQLEKRIDAFAAALAVSGGALVQVERQLASDGLSWRATVRYTFPARPLAQRDAATVTTAAA